MQISIRLAVLCLVGIVAVVSASTKDHQALFKHFKSKHGKSYASTTEEEKRFAVFRANMDEADRHASTNPHAQFGVTKFSDMTAEEFRASHGYVSARASGRHFEEMSVPTTQVLPKIDWRTKGAVTPVKDQGQCGSCWSFSATGSIEGQMVVAAKKPLVSLSEQQFVSCSPANCNGGDQTQAWLWVLAYQGGDVFTEASYPYVSGDTKVPKCNTTKKIVGATITNANVLPRDEVSMQAFVSSNGPLAIGLDASSFQMYQSGVMTNCISKQDNHAVLIVGYDSTSVPPYWIVKNQWGTGFGEDGYIRIVMFKKACMINDSPMTAIIGPSTPQPGAIGQYLCGDAKMTYCGLTGTCCDAGKVCCASGCCLPTPPSTATPKPTAAPTTAKPTTAKPTTAKPPTSKPTTAKPTAVPTTAKPTPKPPTSKPTTAKPTPVPTTAKPTPAPTTAKPTPKPPTSKPTTAKPTPMPTTAKPTPAPTPSCRAQFSYCQGLNVCCRNGYSCCTKDICCGLGYSCNGQTCVANTPAPSPCTANYEYCQGLDVCCEHSDSCCTADFCCAAGSLCYDNDCVSACDANYDYCPEQDVCCPADTTCCNEDECCVSGDICQDGQCVTPCDETYSYCDNLDVCCPDSTTCCSATDCCKSKTEICVNSKCVSASSCTTGYNYCSAQGACCPTGTSCCSTAFCCKSGYVCVNEQCVPECDTGYNYCGSTLDVCCPTGSSCCTASTCCRSGSTCSGGKCVKKSLSESIGDSGVEISTAAKLRSQNTPVLGVGQAFAGDAAASSLAPVGKEGVQNKGNAAPKGSSSGLRRVSTRPGAYNKVPHRDAKKPGQ